MKLFRRSTAVALALALTASLAATASGSDVAPAADPMLELAAEHVPNSLIVRFKQGAAAKALSSLMEAHGLSESGRIHDSEDVVLSLKNGKINAGLLKALRASGIVEFAEPDFVATTQWTPNDTYFASQEWGDKKISSEAAWNVTKGASSVLIAVVDTGVDLDHPDLAAKVRTDIDWDFVNNDATAQDDNGHGTHVAGIAAAVTNNGAGVAGTCPNCQILPVKVLSASGSGSYSAIANGIRYAADKGAKVINLSLGGSAGSTALSDAVNYANGKGSLVIAAAGNSNTSAASYPAYYANAVAVAATDQNDYRASFSNYGTWVDTSAPGVAIQSTYWNNTYSSLNGTSMATPYVAGLAGLLFSQGRTQSAVRTRLTSSTYTDAINSTNIPRRINANKAVN